MTKKFLILAAFLTLSSGAHAINWFASGFELGWNVNGGEFNMAGSTQNLVSVSPVRTGTYAFTSSATATAAEILRQINGDTTNNMFCSVWIYISTPPTNLTDIFRYENAAGTSESRIRLNNNRTLECWYSAAQHGSDSSAIPYDTWTRIGFQWNEGTDVASCTLNGTEFANGLSNDLGGGATISLGFQGAPGNSGAAPAVLHYDDLICNTSAGTNNNSDPGDARLVHLYPNAAGDTTTNVGLGGSSPAATVWQSVNQAPPDLAVTVATFTLTSSVAEFNMEPASTEGIGSEDTIQFIAVGTVNRADSAASCSYTSGIKSQTNPATFSTGTATAVANTNWNFNDDTGSTRGYKLISATDPQGGGAWTSALIDTMQLRVYTPTDATPDFWASTVWALVSFIDNAAAGGRRVFTTQ